MSLANYSNGISMNDLKTRKKAKKKILLESTVVFFIAISPFLYKLHNYLPQDPEATISFLWMEIDRNGFYDVATYIWFVSSKVIPLYLFVLWFLTSKNWWYHIILIPIAMYAFQLFEVIYSDDQYVDTDNLLWLLPVCMVVVPFVYFIRIKLYDRYVHGIDLEAMEAELQALKAKQDHKKPQGDTNTNEEKVDLGELSLSERIDYLLSTRNLESYFRNFQTTIQNWLHLKF